MLKRYLGFAAAALLLTAAAAQAQVDATLTMRSGEKFSGQLVDLGGVGFTFRYGGTDRQFPAGDVALVQFTNPPRQLNQDEMNQLRDGQHVILFRDGHSVIGHFVDVGERSPLRITVQTSSATTNYHSDEIAAIYMATSAASSTTTAQGSTVSTQPAPAGAIAVPANQQWTATGIAVRKGEVVNFQSSGEVQLSANGDDKASPSGSASQRKAAGAPLPNEFAGALIAKIGANGQPFAIGGQTSIPMPAAGPLYLGINDDGMADNAGQFNVKISRSKK